MALKNTLFIFDACSLINLYYIDDDDDFLKNLLHNYPFLISEKVFTEIRSNISKNINTEEDREKIDSFLGGLRNKVFDNRELETDLGKELIDSIIGFNDYRKNNGEFYSTLLSLLKSRIENEYVFFVTDDYPAKRDFSDFFEYQQIGNIINTCDLLTYFYWKHSTFNQSQLKKYLINLRAEYRREISALLKIVRDFSNQNQTIKLDKSSRNLLHNLESNVTESNFGKLNQQIDELRANRKTRSLAKKMEDYSSLVQLDNQGVNTLAKTELKITNLNKFEIYKLN